MFRSWYRFGSVSAVSAIVLTLAACLGDGPQLLLGDETGTDFALPSPEGSSPDAAPLPGDGPRADHAADATMSDGNAPDGNVPDRTLASDTATSSEAGPGAEGGLEAGSEGGAEAGGCSASDLLCNGTCVPNDTRHCGTCANDCTVLKNVSGSVSCTTGVCSFPASSCAAGFADCNSNPSDGCETDSTQPGHCGSCNTACGGGTPVCAASGGSYACASGCATTAPTLCNGTCVDTANNASNCGTCGNACTTSVAHAQPRCSSSVCGYGCNTGYSPCSGACVDTTNDTGNCGSCGNACTTNIGNATATCSSSSCGFTCNSGYSKCSGGCANFSNDPQNCGSCTWTGPAPSATRTRLTPPTTAPTAMR